MTKDLRYRLAAIACEGSTAIRRRRSSVVAARRLLRVPVRVKGGGLHLLYVRPVKANDRTLSILISSSEGYKMSALTPGEQQIVRFLPDIEILQRCRSAI
jgi:hypothetical protein